jgi:hypothetical protein
VVWACLGWSGVVWDGLGWSGWSGVADINPMSYVGLVMGDALRLGVHDILYDIHIYNVLQPGHTSMHVCIWSRGRRGRWWCRNIFQQTVYITLYYFALSISCQRPPEHCLDKYSLSLSLALSLSLSLSFSSFVLIYNIILEYTI